MVGPAPIPPPYDPPVSTRFLLGLGRRTVSLVQGFANENQIVPWFSMGGAPPIGEKEVCIAIPRGPIVITIEGANDGTDVYLGEFNTIEDLANAAGRDILQHPAIPALIPLAWSVPGGETKSKVFTPQSDFLAIAVVGGDPNSVATLMPVGIVDRGPSSMILPATGPDISF